MNIFFLDRDITKCAQAHVDKHVSKMILEGAQLLASAHHMLGAGLPNDIYRLTHKNHQCAIWVRSSARHYEYLLNLMEELDVERKYRGSRTTHLSLVKARSWGFPPTLQYTDWQDPPKCVHDDFKNVPDVIDAYRAYYKRDKAHIHSWNVRGKPNWM